ncbi:rod shape-determining protein [uncultured Anaerococcus sp.]|uniref:rod shape-determining protein n=1 Tax=uncultured Anaerococcus sp. TaxID=293428 RepID=UPI0026344AD5|nr:rod shape-determining protein [uncultured Anaerococcus sp.]
MKLKLIATDFAIDLGTSNILVYKKGEGLIINEPSSLVLDDNYQKVLAVGQEAKDMLGKTHQDIQVVKPIKNGVITDFNLTEAMLNYFFEKVNEGFSFIQPKVVIVIPSGITDIQKRAVEDAALHAGSRDIILVDESLACAYGMNLSPEESKGILLINMGAGTSQVAVISLNGIVTSKTINKGGDYLDEKIVTYFRENKNLEIGKNTAEKIKIKLASLKVKDANMEMSVDGRDLIDSKPRTEMIKSNELVSTILPFADEICDMVYEVLEKTPPEISADIKKNGFGLSGSLSQLAGMAEYIEKKIGLKSYHSEDPSTDAILGAGMILENPEKFMKYRK